MVLRMFFRFLGLVKKLTLCKSYIITSFVSELNPEGKTTVYSKHKTTRKTTTRRIAEPVRIRTVLILSVHDFNLI